MIQEGEVTVVHLAGRIDVESAQVFRDVLAKRLGNRSVVFDFRGLSFVGSSGIIPFLDALQKFYAVNATGLKFSSVCIEFRRIFAATPLREVLIYETSTQAVDSYRNPQAIMAVPLLVNNPHTDNGFLTLNREADADGEIDESVLDSGTEEL